jgi:hypothetical protein
MAEARLSFEERKTITNLIQFFHFLKCVHIFLAPSEYLILLSQSLKMDSSKLEHVAMFS